LRLSAEREPKAADSICRYVGRDPVIGVKEDVAVGERRIYAGLSFRKKDGKESVRTFNQK
jgi:hypothetical protein